ncbi:MAG: hypothetical protein IPF84_15585 [Proteobacteria bacterium]|nr:hypothetical protein [Pseudomonadota bacterium]
MTLAFSVALGHFVQVLEQELLRRVVQIELQKMTGTESSATDPITDQGGGMRRWVAPVDQQARLPEPLQHMREGVREIEWDQATEVFAGKKIVGAKCLRWWRTFVGSNVSKLS